MTHTAESAYDRWTWGRCGPQILTLKDRLGFGERLWILGFELLDDGRLIDVFLEKEVFDPNIAIPATRIPALYSAVPEMYCILSTYAAAQDIPLSGEQISLASINQVMRWELSAEDCTALLEYTGRDFAVLQKTGVPFFGARLDQGDLAFEVWPLPRAPMILIFWRGDEELAPSGTLLFDRSVSQYLQGLVAEFAWLTIWRLRNILDPGIKWGYHQLA